MTELFDSINESQLEEVLRHIPERVFRRLSCAVTRVQISAFSGDKHSVFPQLSR